MEKAVTQNDVGVYDSQKARIQEQKIFLYPEREVAYGEINILTCLVNGAFPPTINVTLQVNGEPLDAGVNSSRLSFGDDWRFRVLRYAQIRPAAGDLYSCEVLHTISNEVKVVYWEPEVAEPWEESTLDSGQLGTLAAGLIVGFLGTAAGYCLFFWPKVAIRNFSLLRTRSSVRSSSSA
ncbi:beta-2-microglobulin-like [Scyliorhinus canicula]|uniref:beta-2-microglobulin-like n=1 Tax=Scyliorhinus canicula TaxID=7830 RepID=UPI0018F56257|nr:beta-2-microglobulin-like [Scyliorhinus canicula]